MENQKTLKTKIQTEQHALLKVEKKLKEMISKVHEHLNTLKVEELQLKANLLSSQNKYQPDEVLYEQKYKTIEVPEFINTQTLDLDIGQFCAKDFNEEFDSE